MNADFGEAAARCCSLAAQILGWRPSEFWSATPAELAMALRTPADLDAATPPTPDTIARMMERDSHE